MFLEGKTPMCTGLGKSVLFVSFLRASPSPPILQHWKGTIFHCVRRNKNGTENKDPKVSREAMQEGLGDLEVRNQGRQAQSTGHQRSGFRVCSGHRGQKNPGSLKLHVADGAGPFVFLRLVT